MLWLSKKEFKLKALIIKLETINLISGNSTEWSSIRPVILHQCEPKSKEYIL